MAAALPCPVPIMVRDRESPFSLKSIEKAHSLHAFLLDICIYQRHLWTKSFSLENGHTDVRNIFGIKRVQRC